MLEQIRQLEQVARRLEPDGRKRRHVREAVVQYGETFLNTLETTKVFDPNRERVAHLFASPLQDQPSDIGDLLTLLGDAVTTPGLKPASGAHMGYIPGGGVYVSALGDYLAAVTNEFAGVSFTGPGAVAMETMLLDWMAKEIGYPPESGGNLTSGGSIANLIAIVTARDAMELAPMDIERAVVYLSEQTHHCVDKALRIAGLGASLRRFIPLDSRSRMIPEELHRVIGADQAAGLRPWLVVGSAGTTDVGAIDPLTELSEIAHAHQLWFHVDGAYGGFFVLSEGGPATLEGMAQSDSIVLDPHKGLFLPYGVGAVLIRDRAALHHAHYYDAGYMQDAHASEDDGDLLSPAELSPELTKHFRGLRCWLPLKLHGVAPFRACLDEKLLLARYFHDEVSKLGFEVGPPPELSVVAFRWIPERGDPDAFNQKLIDAIHRDGRVFLSSSRINGRFILRMAALCFRTHLDTINLTLRVLRNTVQELGG
ncbi:MAG: pyridoxal-dependent decarboxylase [Acidobacteriota bacterium]|nr:pyridoxal-dependent decarboxylase [Acidobacteriota bacterium]